MCDLEVQWINARQQFSYADPRSWLPFLSRAKQIWEDVCTLRFRVDLLNIRLRVRFVMLAPKIKSAHHSFRCRSRGGGEVLSLSDGEAWVFELTLAGQQGVSRSWVLRFSLSLHGRTLPWTLYYSGVPCTSK